VSELNRQKIALEAQVKDLERRVLLAESKSLDTDAMLDPITKRIAALVKLKAELEVHQLRFPGSQNNAPEVFLYRSITST
jgi:hypothetical protein